MAKLEDVQISSISRVTCNDIRKGEYYAVTISIIPSNGGDELLRTTLHYPVGDYDEADLVTIARCGFAQICEGAAKLLQPYLLTKDQIEALKKPAK